MSIPLACTMAMGVVLPPREQAGSLRIELRISAERGRAPPAGQRGGLLGYNMPVSSSEADVLRREARALGELAALQRDPVFRGHGLPRGDGRIVLVLPGLFGNDLYLQPLHLWLRRI